MTVEELREAIERVRRRQIQADVSLHDALAAVQAVDEEMAALQKLLVGMDPALVLISGSPEPPNKVSS